MVHAVLEVVSRWIKPQSQPQNRVIVVESSDSAHSFLLGAMIAKVLHKPYFDLRQSDQLQTSDFCVVSKSQWESGWQGCFVVDVDEIIRELRESHQQSPSPLAFQCLRVAVLRLAAYRQARRKGSR